MNSHQIVDTAAVTGRSEKLFCLGPFPRLVSFSAQQYRALNLVWALRENDKFSIGDSVAVIGAGVAGLTAAAGFIGYGCKVDVYEAGAVAMSRQRATDHRLVHPTLNQWPDPPLSMTTQLPFLEWYSGVCSEVVKNLWDQFASLKGANRVLTNRRVVDIADIATDLVQLIVHPAVEPNPTYKLVLIAIGFGQEWAPNEFAACDYWEPDGLERVRNQQPQTNFIVSGCGDGGLIDALRLAHRNFEKGKLVFDTAAELFETPLAKLIRKGEGDARSAKDPRGLSQVYIKAAEMLMNEPQYAATAERLKLSLWENVITYLLDRNLSAPYSLNSAPIHKLLVRHAEANGRIRFYQGTAQIVDGKIRAADRSFPGPPLSRVIIRHGAKPNFDLLLTGDEINKLEEKQRLMSDYHATKLWTSPFPVPPHLPPHEFQNKVFIEDRKKLAKKALNHVSTDADLMVTESGYRITYDDKIPTGAPTQLFGIAVENEIIASSSGISG
jgi:hypothetical protein